MAEDSMVMPRSCSSGRESRYLILPASFGDIMPFVAMRASVREVLPWSCLSQQQRRNQDRVRTYNVGHDADVAHIVGIPLQLNKLLGRDYRHGGW
jgi:hypothetical protein